MMLPSAQVDQLLVLLIKRQIVSQASNHVWCHIGGIKLLKSLTELVFENGLLESLILAHHVDLLLFILDDLFGFLGSLYNSTFALWLLEVVLIVLSEWVVQINVLVSECSFEQLQCQVDLVNLSVLMPAK